MVMYGADILDMKVNGKWNQCKRVFTSSAKRFFWRGPNGTEQENKQLFKNRKVPLISDRRAHAAKVVSEKAK